MVFYEELINNSTWVWMEYHGTIGYTATSMVNGNKLFFPIKNQTTADYWTASLQSLELATVLLINERSITVAYGSRRYLGLPVRAVTN